MREKVRLTKRDVTTDIKEHGLTRKELAEKYGLPVTQMNKALKFMGLDKVKASKIMFEIVEEDEHNESLEEPLETVMDIELETIIEYYDQNV